MTKQWDKLPVGTVLLNTGGKRLRTTTALIAVTRNSKEALAYMVEGLDGYEQPDRLATVREGHRWEVSAENFADPIKRVELGKLGFFSIDHNGTTERHAAERVEERRRADAYAGFGLDRKSVLFRLAGLIDAKNGGDIRATSTGEYAKKREALDNAILYATGANVHA